VRRQDGTRPDGLGRDGRRRRRVRKLPRLLASGQREKERTAGRGFHGRVSTKRADAGSKDAVQGRGQRMGEDAGCRGSGSGSRQASKCKQG